ncbi:MAG: hypothetical protein ACRC8U_01700, partial [Brooklawnia sp.]
MPTYPKTSLERIEFEAPKLKYDKLPLIVDDWTLAFRLGFTGRTLWYLMRYRDNHYKMFKIRKASGGMRVVHDPSPLMRLFTKQIRARILLPLTSQLGPHVGAYQIGKSTKDTAMQHLFACPVCDTLDQPHSCTSRLEENGATYRIVRENTGNCPACKVPVKHDCPRRGVKIHLDLKDFFSSTRRSFIRKYFH